MKKAKNKKPKSLKQLKKEADAIFSKFIRIRDKATCFTCGVKKEVKEMQNGHFFPRNKLNTRYCEINCNAQCHICNIFRKGNLAIYAANIARKYGGDALSELATRADMLVKYSRSDYEELIEKYKQKVSELNGN